jgi:hypothetical protein
MVSGQWALQALDIQTRWIPDLQYKRREKNSLLKNGLQIKEKSREHRRRRKTQKG